jgi:hypothetical protein
VLAVAQCAEPCLRQHLDDFIGGVQRFVLEVKADLENIATCASQLNPLQAIHCGDPQCVACNCAQEIGMRSPKLPLSWRVPTPAVVQIGASRRL